MHPQPLATSEADPDLRAAALPLYLPARPPVDTLHAVATRADAARTHPNAVGVPTAAGCLSAAAGTARLAQPLALFGGTMRSKKHLNRARLVGLLVTLAAVAFAVIVFVPFSLPWSHSLRVHLQAGALRDLKPRASAV